MLITAQKSLFVAHTTYEERFAANGAGFYWHGKKCKPGCLACKNGVMKGVWWTPTKENAARLYKYADAGVKALLKDHVKAVIASKATNAAIEIPVPEGLSLFPYQKAGVQYATERPGTLIGDEMGLGKTVQALVLPNMDETIQSVLVLCPGSLRLNWLKEAEKWLIRPFSFYVAENSDPVPEDVNFVIVNPDKLVGDSGQALFDSLMAREWDLFIVDEAHMYKNPDAQRTVRAFGRTQPKTIADKSTGESKVLPIAPGLVDRAKKKVALTGTPLPNRPAELYPIVQALDPNLFPNRRAFTKRYVKNSQKHLPELQEKLRAALMVRRLKSEVLKDLPPKQRQVIVIPPNGATDLINQEKAAWSSYEDAIAKFKAEKVLAHAAGDKEAYENALASLKDTLKAAFSEISKIRHEVALAKVPYVLGHLDEMRESGIKKIIVFAHHKDVIHTIADHFGEKAVVLTGETPMAERQAAVDRFQTDDSCEVFIGGLKAAGVGITLTASCNVVFAEQDWTPSVLTQAEDRAHRIGQLWSVLCQHIVFDESLDARMAHYIIEKQAVADLLLDADTSVDVVDAPPEEVAGKKFVADATLAPLPKKYPLANDNERALAKQAMQLLAGMCDGAVQKDGAGFNKIDTKIGKSLAAQVKPFTDGQVFLARRLAKIYRKQLPDDLVVALGFNKKSKGKKGAN